MTRTRTRATNRSRTQPVDQPDSDQEPLRDERDEVQLDDDEEEIVEHDGQGGGDPPEDGGDDSDEDDDEEGEDDDDEDDSGDDDDEDEDEDAPGALTPGQARPNGTLRYQKVKAHDYLYKNATKPLNSEELFDCAPDQFFAFMKSLEIRGDEFGWTRDGGILWVRRKDGVMINLLTGYGSISLKRIQRHEKTYWNNGRRPAQDDRMLYECIMSSLSAAGKDKVLMHSEDYKLKSGNELIPSGLCLLKVVVRESYLDSDATTGMIREQLSNLDMFMPTVNNDITRFNNHVKMLLQALTARNERTLDLLTYLFKAYKVCNDTEFVDFIKDIQTDHDMGTKRIDAKELMSLTEKKFKIMKTQNKWEAPSHQDEKIMALQARLDKVQVQLKKAGNNKQKDDDRKNGKFKKGKPDKRPDWFDKPPAPGKMHETKEWKNKTWHYCCKETGGKCGGIWRVHDPKECTGKGKRKPHGDGKKFQKFQKKQKKEEPDIELSAKTTTFNTGGEDSDSDTMMGGYFSDE